MSRYKGRPSVKYVEREHPYHVDISVPEGGLRRRIDDMNRWHHARGLYAVMGGGGMNVARFCFQDQTAADDFAKAFSEDRPQIHLDVSLAKA